MITSPDDAEYQVFVRALNSFRNYEEYAIEKYIRKRQNRLNRLSLEDRQCLLPRMELLLQQMQQAIQANGKIAKEIANIGQSMVDALFPEPHSFVRPCTASSRSLDQEKTQSTIRQIAREWSNNSKTERDEVLVPILQTLLAKFNEPLNHGSPTVVCPGSGLNRLPYELSQKGFNAIGNEISPHMLFASNFVINETRASDEFLIFPYVHGMSGHRSSGSLLQPVRFPDAVPSEHRETREEGTLSMAMGEFVESFKGPESKNMADAVVTSFFLDTSANVMETIRVISQIAKPGSYWVNCGPLAWHFEDYEDDIDDNFASGGIELTMEDIYYLICEQGWIVEERKSIKTTYCGNSQAMTHTVYDCEFFVARKSKS